MAGKVPRSRRTEFHEMGPEAVEQPAKPAPRERPPGVRRGEAHEEELDESMMEAIRRGLKIPEDEAALSKDENAHVTK